MDDFQMDGFDRLLEFQLRRKLDALVAAPAPARRGQAGLGRPSGDGRGEGNTKKMGGILIKLWPELVLVEHS